ncbi:MAG: AraC family transcriptional regulator, partial [Paracoccaceae bacterium]|nr:AraC family transcriptional regulator [Paracoccaceae bacterium]
MAQVTANRFEMLQNEPLVPKGAAYFPAPDPGPTRCYAFILVPGFTLLAFVSAVEPLRIANQWSQKPLYRWRVLSETGEPVASSSGIPVGVDGRIEPQDKATRLFVCAGNPQMAAASPAVVAAVQRHHRFGGIVGGICTGAIALARGGLLDGRRFTLHWENQPGFVETFPDLAPSPARFEIDGPVMTCGGGAASTDMMLS